MSKQLAERLKAGLGHWPTYAGVLDLLFPRYAQVLDRIPEHTSFKDPAYKGNQSHWTVIWSRAETENWFDKARAILERKGFKYKEVRYAKRHHPSFDLERAFVFHRIRNDEHEHIIFVGLADFTWMFDFIVDGLRMPQFTMQPQERGSDLQGVPISMTSPSFTGIFSPYEGRQYQANWRRTLEYLNTKVK
jgi:hypothetical protein